MKKGNYLPASEGSPLNPPMGDLIAPIGRCLPALGACWCSKLLKKQPELLTGNGFKVPHRGI